MLPSEVVLVEIYLTKDEMCFEQFRGSDTVLYKNLLLPSNAINIMTNTNLLILLPLSLLYRDDTTTILPKCPTECQTQTHVFCQ